MLNLCLKMTYICLAISKLRFMYSAKSLELFYGKRGKLVESC